MIIRSGWGIVIPFVFAIPVAIVVILFTALSSGTEMPVFAPIGSIIGAALGWFALRKLHQHWENIPGQHLIDKNTGEELIYRKKNTLFFMGTKIRLYIFGVVAVAMGVGGLVGLYATIVAQ